MKCSPLVIVIALCAGCMVRAPDPGNALALVGITVIDPSSTSVALVDQTVLISDGFIRRIGRTDSVEIPAGTNRINAAGKYLIPGLWDAHVHFMNTGVSALPVFLANGVTSVREMGGYVDSTRAWQARMRAGTLEGPRIVSPGPMLESPRYLQGVRDRSVRDPRIGQRVLPYRLPVADSLAAERMIDSLVSLHVDFVKFRTVASPAAYFAIVRAAHRAGLKVAGHVPGPISMFASDSGQDDVEHAIFPVASRRSSAEQDSLYRVFGAKHRWYTPTLVVTREVTYSGDSAKRLIFGPDAMRTDQRRAYASPWLLEWWQMQVQERSLDTSATRSAEMEAAYRSSAGDIRKMLDAGARILAGTDAGSVLVYPGFSLHEELELLVRDANLTPREVLWSATLGPATFAGLGERLGRIQTGQIADLVVLDANPLADIRNTRRIFAVIQNGQLFDRARLDSLLRGVRASVAVHARGDFTPPSKAPGIF